MRRGRPNGRAPVNGKSVARRRPARVVSRRVIACSLDSPVGVLWAAESDGAVRMLTFARRPLRRADLPALSRRLGGKVELGRGALLQKLERELRSYFEGGLRRFSVPVALEGTPFEQRVWKGLRQIPYGRTVSYTDLARRIRAPRAQRAVGQANGRNPVAIVVPCHRVISKGRRLGGFGGGTWRKRVLLEVEGVSGVRPG